jgi:hypothetical protein
MAVSATNPKLAALGLPRHPRGLELAVAPQLSTVELESSTTLAECSCTLVFCTKENFANQVPEVAKKQ